MISSFIKHYRRAKITLQTDGLLSLLKHALFFRGTYFLYQVNPVEALKERNETDFVPKIQNFTLKTLSTLKQADELAAHGYRISSADRTRLAEGQTALCSFVERELAHIMWAAMTEEAKNGAEMLPFKVDFSKNEACGGWTWTNPKYRGMGICTYVGIKRLQFLKDRGIVEFRSFVNKDNVAAQRTLDKLGHKKYAEGRYLRILGWKHWKEKPLT